ncbi:YjfB family protein [Pseudomonas sp. GV071]|uniref:YjfB family protein n=1 Tax=Pseudomonas sp. GV071 TaxID=2135754 RepID=UPI000D3A348A|nr:YjfB family protein [Pseudomonas sp. GV071]PTQ67073.1 putative motility protein YjfB-like [Pseudomonas sp. GV071]
MDISSVGAAVSNAHSAKLASDVSIKMLSKALDLQSSSAMALIQAIPDLSAVPSNPPNLGNAIDVMV